MTVRIMNRYLELIAIKNRKAGRNISNREVARETGLSKTTVDAYARNAVTRFDEPVVLAFLDYFGCDLGDFLIVEEIEARGEDETPEESAVLATA